MAGTASWRRLLPSPSSQRRLWPGPARPPPPAPAAAPSWPRAALASARSRQREAAAILAKGAREGGKPPTPPAALRGGGGRQRRSHSAEPGTLRGHGGRSGAAAAGPGRAGAERAALTGLSPPLALQRVGLQLRATLENITRLRAEGEDFRWYLKLKCGNCGEVSEKWQYLRLMDSAPLKGGRGSATMVQKCKLCSRENSIDILSQTIKPYNAEDSEKFKTIVEFECRGLEPVDFQPQAGFAAEGAESGTPFNDINLLEKDWNDYDEKTKESVGIYEVTHKFVKC
uniref:CXXC motif containing zinc binding protein n=6 Tax=Aves TaxID=8782 RepID=A0A8B9NYG9_APTOW